MCRICGEMAKRLGEIREMLDSAQDRILHEPPASQLAEELLGIASQLDELEAFRLASFEHAAMIARLREKTAYLMGCLSRLAFEARLSALQDRLRSMVTGDAWEVYLEIEELVNMRMGQLSANSPEVSRELLKEVERR